MKPFILYSRMGTVTGRALREALEIPGGREVKKPKDVNVLVRWGHSTDPDVDSEILDNNGRVINQARYITRSSNRHYMLHDLSAVVNRSTVMAGHALRFHHNPTAVPTSDLANGNNNITLLRHRYSRWGNDIIVLQNTVEIDQSRLDGYFSVEYWPADHEVRVHVMDGRSIYFQIKKRRVPPETTPTPGAVEIRNNNNGWGLYPLDNDEARRLGIQKRPLREAAKLICKGFKLDFAAVDFLVRTPTSNSPDRFNYKVLELNTSPGLEGTTLARYVTNLRAMLNGTPAEHDTGDGADTPTPTTPVILEPSRWTDFLSSPASRARR